MHVLIVADGRSPITRRWLQGLLERGMQVGLISTFPCPVPDFSGAGLPGVEPFSVLPVAFSRLASGDLASTSRPGEGGGAASSGVRRLVRRFRSLALSGRYVFGPHTVENASFEFQRRVLAARPDLVHALRIPFEGMLASHTPDGFPLVVSIWGNDLTLHARGSRRMGDLTVRCLRRAQGLMADARRDLRLARLWGFPAEAPALAVPGSGGLRLEELRAAGGALDDLLGSEASEAGSPARPLIVNPRGLRPGSVRTDTFFKAIPRILASFPDALFACPSMAGQAEAAGWVERLGIAARVRLLPTLPQPRLWALLRRAEVFVSPSAHDGTPNSVLEGMACGSFPIAGDIESLREWITPGVNGMLVDPADPDALAEAVCLALRNPGLRARAAAQNGEIIARRAASACVMEQVEDFYRDRIAEGLKKP